MKFNVIRLDRTASTNSYAQELLQRSGAREGTIVWTDDQFEGRGQGSNSWCSQAGKNLTFSLILEPLFLPPAKQFILNKTMALAVLKSLRQLIPAGIQTFVKWPNDIYAGESKIAGILIEHNIIGASIKNSVIGIGLNLNQEEYPADIPNPVSLMQISGKEYKPGDVLETVCGNLEAEYSRLRYVEHHVVDNEYNISLMGLGIELDFTGAGFSFRGRIQGVDDSGRLCVLTAEGVTRIYNHGEIRFSQNIH